MCLKHSARSLARSAEHPSACYPLWKAKARFLVSLLKRRICGRCSSPLRRQHVLLDASTIAEREDDYVLHRFGCFSRFIANECPIRNCHLVSVLLCELGADNLKLISCIDGRWVPS